MRVPLLTLSFLSFLLAAATQAEEAPKTGPVKGLKVHEWGVFVVGQETMAKGGGEPLDFMVRPELLPPPPKNRGGGAGGNAGPREPILHVYAERPTALKVEISFPSGGPTLVWPPALQTGAEAMNGGNGRRSTCPPSLPCLTWSFQAGGKGEVEPPKVPEGHWIESVRKVGASRLFMNDGKAAEDFLFYEGRLTDFQDPVRLEAATEGEALLSSKSVPEAWYVLSDEKGLKACHPTDLDAECDLSVRAASPLKPQKPEALRAELAQSLKKAGLTEKEASALLDIWMLDLVKPGRRLVYVLPRSEYDRLLPIRITPQPEELARVGLVLKEIGS